MEQLKGVWKSLWGIFKYVESKDGQGDGILFQKV